MTRILKNGFASNPISEAQGAIDELIANGALFTYRPAGSLPPSFVYEIPGAGDRRRCRQIIAEAKMRPKVWAAMLAKIAAMSATRAA